MNTKIKKVQKFNERDRVERNPIQIAQTSREGANSKDRTVLPVNIVHSNMARTINFVPFLSLIKDHYSKFCSLAPLCCLASVQTTNYVHFLNTTLSSRLLSSLCKSFLYPKIIHDPKQYTNSVYQDYAKSIDLGNVHFVWSILHIKEIYCYL